MADTISFILDPIARARKGIAGLKDKVGSLFGDRGKIIEFTPSLQTPAGLNLAPKITGDGPGIVPFRMHDLDERDNILNFPPPPAVPGAQPSAANDDDPTGTRQSAAPQVVTPQERIARTINETSNVDVARVVIQDESGRAWRINDRPRRRNGSGAD